MYFNAAGRILQAFRGETLPIGVDFVWPFGAAAACVMLCWHGPNWGQARPSWGRTQANWGQAQSDLTANRPRIGEGPNWGQARPGTDRELGTGTK